LNSDNPFDFPAEDDDEEPVIIRKPATKAKKQLHREADEDAALSIRPPESRERQEQIGRALYNLPEKQRRAIELAFLDGYTQREIANILKEPLGTVKTCIRRGIAMMRIYLANESTD
jgi:RNA polymerase sigma factor (sigma-70 family)